MSAFWGYVWMAIMISLAIGAWCFNVIYVDNAVPPVLNGITSIFTHPIVDYSGQAIFWMTAMDYAPLFFILCGVIGFILECTIWGTSTDYQQ